MNVLSAHVTVAEGAEPAATLDALCACLSDDSTSSTRPSSSRRSTARSSPVVRIEEVAEARRLGL